MAVLLGEIGLQDNGDRGEGLLMNPVLRSWREDLAARFVRLHGFMWAASR